MKTLTVITIFAALLFQIVNGLTQPSAICTMEYKICVQGKYLGTGASGCPECLECPMVKLAACPDGSSPLEDPPVENQCPTHSCPKEPIVCTKEYKICVEGKYLGTGASGCPECLECPMVLLAACPDGSTPVQDPTVENQCPTYSCPEEPVMCTMDYKICAQGQYLGTGADGCPECLECPMVKLAACWNGSYPRENPPVENECPTYYCPRRRCIGRRCFPSYRRPVPYEA